MRAFLSSTFDDLKEERKVLFEVFQRTGIGPVAQDFFGARNCYPIEAIQECMQSEGFLYVLIIGGRYGSLVPESRLPTWAVYEDRVSYSEIEFDLSGRLKIPRLVYLKANLPRSAYDTDQQQEERRRRFITKISSQRCTYCPFNNLKQLAVQSAIDVVRLLNDIQWRSDRMGPDYRT